VSAKDAAKLLPSREQFVRVWRALEREVDGTLTSPELPFLRRLSAEALGAESFPRTVMCLAVFAERGLVTVERHDKYITLRLTGNKRVDLDASPYLCALREGLDETKGGSSV
jgi:single-stranded-DNA-specific exonuclease